MTFMACALLVLACIPTQGAPTVDAAGKAFEPGQVWDYRTRPLDDGSRLIILKVEHDSRLGTIVHIAVTNARLRGSGTTPMTIKHMPFAEEMLRKSVVRLVTEHT